MDKRVGPWINKKIVEYVGEEEPSLRDFICNKVYCGVTVLFTFDSWVICQTFPGEKSDESQLTTVY